MDRHALLIVCAAAAACAWMVSQWPPADDADAGLGIAQPLPQDPSPTFMESIVSTVVRTFQTWRPPAQYAPAIALAEDTYSIPRDLLARLLYQESRWRADIISGATRSPVGALGIAQFMPDTAAEMGIDPLNPRQAIDAAGRYLARLYRSLGSWSQALAAYNWGIGNVQRRGLDAAPLETRRYFSEILADVNAAHGSGLA